MSEQFSTAMDVLRAETRAALRRLLRRPSASIVSVLALACGIGAATATWSLMNALLLNPLPVAEADDVFEVGIRSRQRLSDTFTYRMYPVIRESEAFASLVGGALMWVVAVPLSYGFGLHLGFGVFGVWLAMTCDECLRGFINYRRWLSGAWQRYSIGARAAP